MNFDSWLREVDIWKCVTELDAKKQAPAIYLALEGQAKRCCGDIKVEELNKDDGVATLIAELKSLYKRDEKEDAFTKFEEFESFTRPEDMNVLDYINEFDRLNMRT